MSTQKNLITLCIATVFTLGLAACGGGGGDAPMTSMMDGGRLHFARQPVSFQASLTALAVACRTASDAVPRPSPCVAPMPKTPSFHEELDRADEVTGGSSRAFGLVFTVVLTIVGLWPLLAADRPRLLVLAAAVGLLAIAVARPGWLGPFNKAWLRFGALLGRVVNPVVMALLFFAFVTPFALIARALGKDPLRLRFDGTAKSYWIERKGPDPESMRRQF